MKRLLKTRRRSPRLARPALGLSVALLWAGALDARPADTGSAAVHPEGATLAQVSNLSAAAAPTASTQPAAAPLTLADCVRRALTHGPRVQQKREDVSIASEKVAQAYASFAPTVVFQPQVASQTPLVDFADDLDGVLGQLPTSLGDLGDGLGGRPGQNIPAPSRPSFGGFPSEVVQASFVAQVPIYVGGKRLAGLDLARTNLDLEQTLLLDAGQKTSHQVMHAFVGILAAHASLDMLGQITRELERIAADTRRLKAKGFVTEADVLDVEATLADVRAQAVKARAQVRAAERGMNMLLGRDIQAPLVLVGTLDAPGAALLGGPPGALFDEDRRGADALVEQARGARADLDARRLQLSLAEHQVALKRADLPFTPSLVAQLQGGVRGTKLPYINTNWSKTFGPYHQVALVLKIPLFDGSAAASRVRAAQATARQARMGVAQTERLVDVDVRKYHAAVRAESTAVQSAELLVAARAEQHRVASARFRAGELGRAEHLQAFVKLVQARTRRVSAVLRQQQARIDLAMATGALPRTADDVQPESAAQAKPSAPAATEGQP